MAQLFCPPLNLRNTNYHPLCHVSQKIRGGGELILFQLHIVYSVPIYLAPQKY